jgi:hypothetical protein
MNVERRLDRAGAACWARHYRCALRTSGLEMALCEQAHSELTGPAVRFGIPSEGPVMAGKIFLNYRREDLTVTADRLHDRLAQEFGRSNLFGPSKSWIKVKNPKAPAATRAIDGTF